MFTRLRVILGHSFMLNCVYECVYDHKKLKEPFSFGQIMSWLTLLVRDFDLDSFVHNSKNHKSSDTLITLIKIARSYLIAIGLFARQLSQRLQCVCLFVFGGFLAGKKWALNIHTHTEYNRVKWRMNAPVVAWKISMPRLQFSVNSCYIISTSSTLTCFQLFLAWLCHAQTTTQYVMFVEKMCIENEYRFKKKKRRSEKK